MTQEILKDSLAFDWIKEKKQDILRVLYNTSPLQSTQITLQLALSQLQHLEELYKENIITSEEVLQLQQEPEKIHTLLKNI